MPTILRVSGPFDALARAIDASPFAFEESPAARRHRNAEADRTTFNFVVSEADAVAAQASDAEAFLRECADELESLLRSSGVEPASLDVSWFFPTTSIAQSNRFPPALLAICGRMNLEIEVSVYLTDDSGE